MCLAGLAPPGFRRIWKGEGSSSHLFSLRISAPPFLCLPPFLTALFLQSFSSLRLCFLRRLSLRKAGFASDRSGTNTSADSESDRQPHLTPPAPN